MGVRVRRGIILWDAWLAGDEEDRQRSAAHLLLLRTCGHIKQGGECVGDG